MHEHNDNIIKIVDNYHWNKLSKNFVKELFLKVASEVEIIHIDKYLISRYTYSETHNKDAYTFIISM